MLFKLHGQLVQNAHRGRQTLPYRNKYHKIFGLDIFEEEEKILPIVAFPNLGQGSQGAPLTMGQEVHLGFLGQFPQFGELVSEFVHVFGQRGHGHYNPFVQYQGTLPMAEKGGPVRIFHDPIHFCPIKFSIKPTRLGQPRTMIPGMFGFLGRIGQSNMIGSTKEKYGIVQRQPKFALQQNGKIFPRQAVRYVPCSLFTRVSLGRSKTISKNQK